MQLIAERKEAGVVTRQRMTSEVITINFTDDGIDGVGSHLEELDAIRGAEENDIVMLYFSGCPGGHINTGLSIMNAITQSPARVVAVLEGHNASLATMIPMVCDEIVVTPYTTMMVHTAQMGIGYGTAHNAARSASFFSEEVAELLTDLYKGFLTEEEIQNLLDGVELYLTDEQITERIKRRVEVLSKEETVE